MADRIFYCFLILILVLLFTGCESLVTRFEDVQDGVLYEAEQMTTAPVSVDTLIVMTWNIRFAAGRMDWFGDCCGDRVVLTHGEVITGLERITDFIKTVNPDILFLEEVDVESKRTDYVDQMQWLLDHTYFNYGAYASMWQSQVVPSDGIGRINTGNAILSRWKINEAERIQLALRTDQDALTRYFYLRRNLLKTRIALPGHDNFYAFVIHAEAFSTDDTKQKHVTRCVEELQKINAQNGIFILGGDFNLLPPGSDSTDFCDEDGCVDEHFHGPKDNPKHKEGSNYNPEITWLQPMYDNYNPAVQLLDYQSNQGRYFTHTTNHPDGAWNRKLDYLFTSKSTPFITGSAITHQEATIESDHCPVSARWEVPQ